MADLADVMDALQALAIAAVYPGAPGQSVIGLAKVDIAQGWPLPNDVDIAMQAGRALVSIYAVPSSSSDVPQPFMTEPDVLVAPVIGLTAVPISGGLTLTGTPQVGELFGLVGRAGAFVSAAATSSSTAASVAADVGGQLAAAGLGSFAAPASVLFTAPLTVRQGAPGTLSERIHRQRIQFRIVVWAPKPALRSAVARVVDVALKRNVRVALPDATFALVTFQGTNLHDKYENNSAYRRDLIFNVQFDTTDQYQGLPIIAVPTAFSPLP